MKSGQCPKFNNMTVYKKTGGIGFGEGGYIYVYTQGSTYPDKTEDYICTTCRYYERYVTNKEKLADVTQTWEKVR